MTDTARPAPVAAAMARAGEEYDQNDRRQGERRHVAAGDDLLEVARTICAIAARRRELANPRRSYYPHADEEGSPALAAARAACLARGYTEDGLAVDGVRYPVASQAPAQSSEAAPVDRDALSDSEIIGMAGAACLEKGRISTIIDFARSIERRLSQPAAHSSKSAAPAAWIDKFGNVYPLGAYSIDGKPNYHDAHKREWRPLYATPTAIEGAAPEDFTAYVVRNYPAGTVIGDPAWHAPKLFAAASRALKSAATEGAAPDLAGLTRWEPCRAVLGNIKAVENGNFYKVADVQAAISKTSSAAGPVPAIVHQALDIALDLAVAQADHVHEAYKGYKQHKHDAADREVETVKQAIDALAPASAAAAPQQPPQGWRESVLEMREASYTISQYPEAAKVVYDSVLEALDELELEVGKAAAPPLMDEHVKSRSAPCWESRIQKLFRAKGREITDADRADNEELSVKYASPLVHRIVAELEREYPVSEDECPNHWTAYRESWALREFVVVSCIQRVKALFSVPVSGERATLGASPSPKLPEGGEAGGEKLTNDQIEYLWNKEYEPFRAVSDMKTSFARAIEAEVQRRCRAQRTTNNKTGE